MVTFCCQSLSARQAKSYNALYLKETGEVKVAAYEEGLENDLNGFLTLQPTFVTADGEFAQIIPAETIAEWLKNIRM